MHEYSIVKFCKTIFFLLEYLLLPLNFLRNDGSISIKSHQHHHTHLKIFHDTPPQINQNVL
jgi:hypothetical protein